MCKASSIWGEGRPIREPPGQTARLSPVSRDLPWHGFPLRVAELLHGYGTPAHRLERVLAKMADTLGVRASFLVTPTSVAASFGDSSPHYS